MGVMGKKYDITLPAWWVKTVQGGLLFFSVLISILFLVLVFTLRIALYEAVLALLFSMAIFFFSMHLRKYFSAGECEKKSLPFFSSKKVAIITSFALSVFMMSSLSGNFGFIWKVLADILDETTHLFIGMLLIVLPIIIAVWVIAIALVLNILRILFNAFNLSQRRRNFSYVILMTGFIFILFIIMKSAGEVLRETIVEDNITSLMCFVMSVIPIGWAYTLFITPMMITEKSKGRL